jgi:hypothetical protein
MFIGVLLSVEFCFTLKTYLKGRPFIMRRLLGSVKDWERAAEEFPVVSEDDRL